MKLPLNVDLQQILLHLFNVVLLFGILYFLLYKPIKDFMEKRTKYYKDMDDKAKADLEEADNTKKMYEEKLAKADEEIAADRTKMTDEAVKEKEEIIKKAREDGDAIIATAKSKAKDEHDRMLEQAKSDIAEMVSLATAKVAVGDVSDSYDSFIEQAGKME